MTPPGRPVTGARQRVPVNGNVRMHHTASPSTACMRLRLMPRNSLHIEGASRRSSDYISFTFTHVFPLYLFRPYCFCFALVTYYSLCDLAHWGSFHFVIWLTGELCEPGVLSRVKAPS
jgi:hypothetical protein